MGTCRRMGCRLGNKSNLSLSLFYLADHKVPFTHLPEKRGHAVDMFLADNQDHTHTVIESSIHLVSRNASDFLDQIENRRNRPRASVYPSTPPFGQNPRQIAPNTAARDMGCAFNRISCE